MEEGMRKVIIIDALNLFIRNYVVNPKWMLKVYHWEVVSASSSRYRKLQGY